MTHPAISQPKVLEDAKCAIIWLGDDNRWFEVDCFDVAQAALPAAIVTANSIEPSERLVSFARHLLPNALWLREGKANFREVIDFVRLIATADLSLALSAPSSRIVVESTRKLTELITAASRYPDLMRQLEPREFELFVAELLSQEGFSVELTPKTRDGGFDIWAWHRSWLGSNLHIVECKRYAEDNPVGIEIVQRLAGVTTMHKEAVSGALVTTSRFTAPAIEAVSQSTKLIKLHDFEYLKSWVSHISAKMPKSSQ